jgi:DNA-directed RNA polymerase sigma subunit (sigma70/sigma32)
MAGEKEITTLEEIGNLFGVTRMRICQIEKKALKKIKNLLSSKYSLYK